MKFKKQRSEDERRYQHQLEWMRLENRLVAELGRPPTTQEMVWARHLERISE